MRDTSLISRRIQIDRDFTFGLTRTHLKSTVFSWTAFRTPFFVVVVVF